MFHTALFHTSLAGNVALTQLNALADDVLTPSGNGFYVPQKFPFLMRTVGVGALLMRAQLNAGSLREPGPFDISPVNVGTGILMPPRVQDFRYNPIALKATEELDCSILNSAAGPTRTTVAVWLSDGPIRPVTGKIISLRYTNAATAAVAFTWTTWQPVMDNALPAGTYALVGSRNQSPTQLIHRYIPRIAEAGRPGFLSGQADGDNQDYMDRFGAMGEVLRFTHDTVPAVQVFCLAADAAATQIGYMDVIKVQ